MLTRESNITNVCQRFGAFSIPLTVRIIESTIHIDFSFKILTNHKQARFQGNINRTLMIITKYLQSPISEQTMRQKFPSVNQYYNGVERERERGPFAMSSSSSFRASSADDVRLAGSAELDEEDSYSGDGSRPTSQRFDSGRYDSFPNYADDKESSKGGIEDKAPYPTGDDIFSSQPMTTEAQDSPLSAFSAGGEFSPERSGNGPILPPPDDMLTEEGFALKEWRR